MKIPNVGMPGFLATVMIILVMVVACKPLENRNDNNPLNDQLAELIEVRALRPLAGNQIDSDLAKVELGRLLFFDKVLSGNKDIACATCHHPTQNSADGLAVSIGTGGSGLGSERVLGYGRQFIPRNAPEVFNRGETGWHSMFWDSRVSLNPDGTFRTPAGADLPAGLENILAAQAMFPVTSRDEMRGFDGESARNGDPNELGPIADEDLPAIWDALMSRLLAIPEYNDLFTQVYPEVPADQLGFQHAANAIAAFEAEGFAFTNSAWTRCLSGELDVISDSAKRGAMLFYGEAQCADCHSGPLLTDQTHYNLAVPQVGPGKGDEAPLDFGLARETGNAGDLYAFRTPSLHNVTLTAPYMHNGAYRTLEAVVRHHLNPIQSLYNYEPEDHLPVALQRTWQTDKGVMLDLVTNLDYKVVPKRVFSDAEVADIVAFLETLTDPAAHQADIAPAEVPSGLPVSDTLAN